MKRRNGLSPEQYLESKVERVPFSGCWIVHGSSQNQCGHVTISDTGKRISAHRYSYEIFKGPVGDKCVLHKCDVPSCVNPDHLFLGTHADNSRDMAAKGRAVGRQNEQHHAWKLTNEQVEEIRRRYAAGGITQQKLADEYGVWQTAISHIVLHRRRNLEAQ